MSLFLNLPRDFPNDMICKILEHSSMKTVIGDDILDKFIIRQRCDINPEVLLQSFVKKKRSQSLVYYTSKKKNISQLVSVNCVKCLIVESLKGMFIDTSMHLCRVFVCHLENAYVKIVTTALYQYINKYNKFPKFDTDRYLMFLGCLATLCKEQGIKRNNSIPLKYIVILLCHANSHELITALVENGYLDCLHDNIIDYTAEPLITKILRSIVINNHVILLEQLVNNGYKVSISDIIIGISYSNIGTVRYLAKFFKPRWYSRGFSTVMLSLARKRKNKKIYQLVEEKLLC
jgi:hypothetical protein